VNEKGMNVFSVDWGTLKSNMLAAFRGDFKAFGNHRSHVERCLVTPNQGWQGYDGKDTERWLKSGYDSEAFKGLGEYDPPLRKKRRIRFVEEGDEFHYDLVASGADNFMSEFTERERIPGLRINIALGFSASVSERVLNRYAQWVCKAIYSVVAIGIDPEISIHYSADGMISGLSAATDTRIRVKKEREVLDFNSFSAMLSPAQFRAYMFCAMFLHAESVGRSMSGGYGHSRRFFNSWGVEWDKEEQMLFIRCDYSGYDFSEQLMEDQLRAALKEMSARG